MSEKISYGQTLLGEILRRSIRGEYIENCRPVWMNGLELDFYYPDHHLAFEFQGDQHFVPVFGVETMAAQRERDDKKKKICTANECILVKVEAFELVKLNVFQKILGAQHWYRPINDRTKRRAWLKSIMICGKKGCLRKPETKRAAVNYCQVLRTKLGSVTAIPKRHRETRKEAVAKYYANEQLRVSTT